MSEAALAAGLAILNTGLELGATSIKNKKAYKYSKRLMDYQNKLNLENWNRVNEYNSPVQERSRLLKAGINPNFGQGSSLAQPIGSPTATMDAAKPDLANAAMQGVQQGLEIKQAKANIKNIEANTNKTNAEADAAWTDAHNKRLFDYLDRGNKLNLDEQTIQGLESEGIISAEQARVARSKATNEVAQQNADLEQTKTQTKLLEPYYHLEERKTGVSEAQQIAEEQHQLRMDRISEKLADGQISKMKAEERATEIANAMNQFLIDSGYFADKYKKEIDEIASVIANNYDEIKKRGMSVSDVAGNALNALVTEPANSFVRFMLGPKNNRNSFGMFLDYTAEKIGNVRSNARQRLAGEKVAKEWKSKHIKKTDKSKSVPQHVYR